MGGQLSYFISMNTTWKTTMVPPPNDRWVFLIIYPLMILGAVHIGNDNPLPILLRLPSYYSDLLLASICTYGAGYYFRYLFQQIDRKYTWELAFRERIFWQLGYGLIVPLLVILGLEIIYLRFFLQIPASEYTLFYLEMPLAIIFLLIINLVYFILYYRKYNAALVDALQTKDDRKKDYLLANRGAKTVQIPVEEVAYFTKQAGLTFLCTASGERFVYDLPLDQIREQLDHRSFFQLNRQVIAGRKSIQAYVTTETRKLAIELHPAPKQTVFVSKAKATDFIGWFRPN